MGLRFVPWVFIKLLSAQITEEASRFIIQVPPGKDYRKAIQLLQKLDGAVSP
jgi:hypothetical protein